MKSQKIEELLPEINSTWREMKNFYFNPKNYSLNPKLEIFLSFMLFNFLVPDNTIYIEKKSYFQKIL